MDCIKGEAEGQVKLRCRATEWPMTEVLVSRAGIVTANGKRRADGDSRGGPPNATDPDDDKESIRSLVSISDRSGNDLDSVSYLGTRAGLPGEVEQLRNRTRR